MTLAHRIATAIREIRDEDGDTIPEVFGERFLMRVAEVAAGVVERPRSLWPAIIGSLIGLAITGYLIVYQPMKRNYDQCGRVTLCRSDSPKPPAQE